jgi:hypothetical protein
MTREEFLKRLEELYANNVAISRAKNADYADGEDPFQNFRSSALYGVPIGQGIIVRMGDKMQRIANLLRRDAKVKDESILDTLSDLANYAMILRMWIESESKP